MEEAEEAVPDEAVAVVAEATGEAEVTKMVKVAKERTPRPGRDTSPCPQKSAVTAITDTGLMRGSV